MYLRLIVETIDIADLYQMVRYEYGLSNVYVWKKKLF